MIYSLDDLNNTTALRSLRDAKPNRCYTCVQQGPRCAFAWTIMDIVTSACLTNGDLPLLIFDALNREFDCGIERLVDDRGRVVTSLDSKQAVIDWLGHEYLAPGDLILSCIDGSAPDPEPGSVLCEQVEIARALLGRNPKLLKDPKTLLLLVEDLYEQRHPPFKVTLRNKSPVVAQLFAEAMLAWANAAQHPDRPKAPEGDGSQEEKQS